MGETKTYPVHPLSIVTRSPWLGAALLAVSSATTLGLQQNVAIVRPEPIGGTNRDSVVPK
jgi:hypothetical protein